MPVISIMYAYQSKLQFGGRYANNSENEAEILFC